MHPPSARRLAEARREGHFRPSRLLTGAVACAAGWSALHTLVPAAFAEAVSGLRAALAQASGRLDGQALASTSTFAWRLFVPVAFAVVAGAIVSGWLQTGGTLVWRSPLRRHDLPVSVGAALRDALLAIVLAGVAAVTLVSVSADAVRATGRDVPTLARSWGVGMGRFLGVLVLVTLAAGAADFVWQRQRLLRSLRMTHAERQREQRETEGEPTWRAERRRRAQDGTGWESATLVVGGPTVAVALRYERDRDAAPVVVGRAGGAEAGRAELAARRASVPVVRDAALATRLADLPLGAAIPEALFEPVALALRLVQKVERSS